MVRSKITKSFTQMRKVGKATNIFVFTISIYSLQQFGSPPPFRFSIQSHCSFLTCFLYISFTSHSKGLLQKLCSSSDLPSCPSPSVSSRETTPDEHSRNKQLFPSASRPGPPWLEPPHKNKHIICFHDFCNSVGPWCLSTPNLL